MAKRFIKGTVVAAALAAATAGLAAAPAQAATSAAAGAHCERSTGSTPDANIWHETCRAPSEPPVAQKYSAYIAQCRSQGGSTDGSTGPTPRFDHWEATVFCYKHK